MRIVIIEEGIFDIKNRKSIKTAIFTSDGKKITRQLLYGEGNRDKKIDVHNIDKFVFTLKDIPGKNILDNNFSTKDFIQKIESDFEIFQNIYKECFQRNIDNELPFFKNPIIKEYEN